MELVTCCSLGSLLTLRAKTSKHLILLFDRTNTKKLTSLKTSERAGLEDLGLCGALKIWAEM